MIITLIKLNENTLEISLENILDARTEYKDKEILYEGDVRYIVCRDKRSSTLSQYRKILIMDLLSETSRDLNNAHEEVLKLNKRYIGLVNKLI